MPATECPTCHAKPGERCQTIWWITLDDGTYQKSGKPTRPHKGRG